MEKCLDCGKEFSPKVSESSVVVGDSSRRSTHVQRACDECQRAFLADLAAFRKGVAK